jgi:tetratricopeptide (TPR) repeat protein
MMELPMPTSNLAAYDLYNRANALAGDITYSVSKLPQINQAIQLLSQAVALDPSFFMAYIRLDYIHESLYAGWDHRPERRALADAALEAASHLLPDDGNTHLQKAYHFYHDLDYDKARAELAEARKRLPNNSLVVAASGFVDRRQGRWEDSIRNLRKALELDPRNAAFRSQLSNTYTHLRRYEDAKTAQKHVLEILPDDINARVSIAMADFNERGDTETINKTIHNVLSQDVTAAPILAEAWFYIALARRDSPEAERALAALPETGVDFHDISLPHSFCEAMLARLRGDETGAHEAFARAHAEAEAQLKATPTYARAFAILGLADAGLGHKQEAIREGRRAAELAPVSKNSLVGSGIIELLSVIYVWTGEKDLALEQLSLSARLPAGVRYGELTTYPWWDPLRGDPRFGKIVASLAPKRLL